MRIAAILIAAALAGGVTAASAAPQHDWRGPLYLPGHPCKSEDSAGPCFWDAGVRGNGHGNSFWMDWDGSRHYLDPSVGR